MTVCRIKNDHLFAEWPSNRLEPYENPAYEGVGYPAAGYGQTRRKVVGLAHPKAENPQLVGWENPQPVGTKVTSMGTLNPHSDAFKREQLAVLMGIGWLGQADYPGPDPVTLRDAQATTVLREADALVAAMKKQVDSPPWGTDASVKAAWQGALKSAQANLARMKAIRPDKVKTEADFKKWLDAVKAIADLALEVNKQQDVNGLLNAVKYTAVETTKTVGKGVVEAGNRALTLVDWLTKPWVLGVIGVGALGIFVYAKSGGSIISVGGRRR